MNKSIANTVRAVFALFLLGLGMYAGIDSLVASELAGRGLSACGSAENPCALAPLKVTVDKSSTRLVTAAVNEQNAAQVLGAAPRAPRAPQAAIAES